MNLARSCFILLYLCLMGACSAPPAPAAPSSDDAGADAPRDFPLTASPEILMAQPAAVPESGQQA